MQSNLTHIITYIAFIWMVVLHTFEELSHGIMKLDLGRWQEIPGRVYGRALPGVYRLLEDAPD